MQSLTAGLKDLAKRLSRHQLNSLTLGVCKHDRQGLLSESYFHSRAWRGHCQSSLLSGQVQSSFKKAQDPSYKAFRLRNESTISRGFAARRWQSTLAADNASMQGIIRTPQAVTRGSLSAGLSDGARKAMAWWLGGTSAWVFSMVVLGGLTRLTRSGLSMTEWKFTGERSPGTQEEWEVEFSKYKASPEFRRVNRSMNLEEFKFIYWMEYAHRMWGRFLGLAFVGPGAVFLWKGYINGPLARRLGLLFLMGGTQGLVGWWMVRSGLQEPEKEYETPRVSPYRLAAHLGSAFAIYSILAWTTLTMAFPEPPLLAKVQTQAVGALKRWAVPLSALLAVTGMSGAFVAGLDAGHAYNTFPLMGGRLFPEEYWQISGWRNAFENTASVQFHHRLLAVSTLSAVLATWLTHRHAPLPIASKRLLTALLSVTCLQVALGITTLITYVPPSLGAAHQATALSLFTVALALLHSLRPVLATPNSIARMATPAAAAGVLLISASVSSMQ